MKKHFKNKKLTQCINFCCAGHGIEKNKLPHNKNYNKKSYHTLF
ncbi:hypothetical protein CHK_2821 [Christensenella hongkongensis]|uniref:Uncharacterized protein n=1 Tax=Christensenella hongkongensis TaxID=270498 RepID=A0A0M2NAV0_9FIRM|nr:hypothetical protein CHK_2821 [Christensenella hongkongensis]